MNIRVLFIFLISISQYNKPSDNSELNKGLMYLFMISAAPGTIVAASVVTIKTIDYLYNYYWNTEAHIIWLEERLKSLETDPKLTHEEKERKKINIPKEIIELKKILENKALKERLKQEEEIKKEQDKSTLSEKLHANNPGQKDSFFFLKMVFPKLNPANQNQNYDLIHLQNFYLSKIRGFKTPPSLHYSSMPIQYYDKKRLLQCINNSSIFKTSPSLNKKEIITPEMDLRLEPF